VKKTVVISARLPASVIKKLEKAAKKSGRTLFKEFVYRIEKELKREDSP
jgi:TraY domain